MKRVLAHVGVFVGGLLAGCALFGGTTQFWAWFWGGTNDEALRTVVDPWPLFTQAPTVVLALVVGVAGYLASLAVGIGLPWYACSFDGLGDDLNTLEANRRRRRERLAREARKEQEEAERIVREYGQPTGPKTTRELYESPENRRHVARALEAGCYTEGETIRIETLGFIPSDVYARSQERQRLGVPYTYRDFMSERNL